MNAQVRLRADDREGRAQIIRYVARPPFAEAQPEVIDDAQVRLTRARPRPARSSARRALVAAPS